MSREKTLSPSKCCTRATESSFYNIKAGHSSLSPIKKAMKNFRQTTNELKSSICVTIPFSGKEPYCKGKSNLNWLKSSCNTFQARRQNNLSASIGGGKSPSLIPT